VYNFRSDPRDNGAVVVLTVDESSYTSASASASASSVERRDHQSRWAR
jgi:hypothetical protein